MRRRDFLKLGPLALLSACDLEGWGPTPEPQGKHRVFLQRVARNWPARTRKKGVGGNPVSVADDVGATWCHDWGPGWEEPPRNVEFVPTVSWTGALDARISDLARHVIFYNEPNEESQANVDPITAAAHYVDWVPTLPDGIKIVSPTISASDWIDDLWWLRTFLDEVQNLQGKLPDYLSLNSYLSVGQTKQFVSDVYNLGTLYGIRQPTWIKEFSPCNTVEKLVDLVNMLEANPLVYRYSYFIVKRPTHLDDDCAWCCPLYEDGKLTSWGWIYAGLPEVQYG